MIYFPKQYKGSLLSVFAGDKNFALKYCKDRTVVMTMAATGILGKGGGLIERPTIETTTPGRESEFDVR